MPDDEQLLKRLDRVGDTLRQMRRDDIMFDTVKTVYAVADNDVRAKAGPFMTWLFITVMRSNAVRVRSLVDERRGTDSLVRALRDLDRHDDAEKLKEACADAKAYVDEVVAHTAVRRTSEGLNITRMERARLEIWRIYERVFREISGEEPSVDPIDRDWAEVFMKPWFEDRELLFWNRPPPGVRAASDAAEPTPPAPGGGP